MSGRPVPLVPFASLESTYPAGSNAWNGTPLRVAPSGDYITPDDFIPAQVLNYELGTLGDTLVGYLNYLGNILASNWPYKQAWTDLRAVCHDSVLGWLGLQLLGGAANLGQSPDGSSGWNSLFAFAPATNHQPTLLASINGSTLFGTQTTATTGGDVRLYVSQNGGTPGNMLEVNDSGVIGSAATVFAGKVLVFFTAGTTHSAGFYIIDPVAEVLGSYVPLVNPGSGQGMIAAASATTLVAMSIGSYPSSYYSTVSDGIPTGHPVAWSTDVPVSLAWSDDGVFMLIARPTGGSGTKVYTSPDGITWTLRSTLTSTLFGLTASGTLWVSANNLIDGTHPCYSVDRGLTWHAPYVAPLPLWTGAALASGLPGLGVAALANVDQNQILLAARGHSMASYNVGNLGTSLG